VAKLKTERHHWWPRSLSQFWANEQGCVHWLRPSGEVVVSPPGNFGMIGNGHHVLLGDPGQPTIWDSSFEADFQRADDNFPAVIEWLRGLDHCTHAAGTQLVDRFIPATVPDVELAVLMEGLISLAVRSPMNREAAVGVAELLRGPLPERERNRLIAVNMKNTHRDAVKQLGIRGKFVALYSPDKEFIFGDGFYHTIRSPLNATSSPTILAPLTPHLAALFVRPMAYTSDPRFFTLVVSAEETKTLNHAVQVYARDKLFYRSEEPAIDDAYTEGKHLMYDGPVNPINKLVQSIPGVQTPNRHTFAFW